MQDKCQCDFRIRVLGDGCRYCQPQEYIDRLHDTMEDMVHVYELSDEEIEKIFGEQTGFTFDCDVAVDEVDMLGFCRDLIAKARGEK